jgi:hypothetical protein
MKVGALASLGLGLSSLALGLVLTLEGGDESVLEAVIGLGHLRSDDTVMPSLQALCSVCACQDKIKQEVRK